MTQMSILFSQIGWISDKSRRVCFWLAVKMVTEVTDTVFIFIVLFILKGFLSMERSIHQVDPRGRKWYTWTRDTSAAVRETGGIRLSEQPRNVMLNLIKDFFPL
jgi:hypothetical protein